VRSLTSLPVSSAAAREAAAGWTAGHRMELLAASSVPVIINVKVVPELKSDVSCV
jgi:hypothetical protein